VVAATDRRRRSDDVGVCRALEQLVRDERAAAVVLYGIGDVECVLEMTRVLQAIESAPQPVVAAVDGDSLGFGFALALACDLAIATPDALLGLPEITRGTASANVLGRAPDVIGRGWTRHLALRGSSRLSGEEAQRLGLIVELHPPEALRSAAVALAREAAGNASFTATKRLLTIDAERTYRLAPSIMPRPALG
jgi:enoyl-CoA hydratase